MLKKLSHIDSAALSLLNEDSLPQRRFHTPISRVLSSLVNRGGVVEALGAIVSWPAGSCSDPRRNPIFFFLPRGEGFPARSGEPTVLLSTASVRGSPARAPQPGWQALHAGVSRGSHWMLLSFHVWKGAGLF